MKTEEHHDLLEDEGAGYLISVSDVMAGLLFVFIITLMAFILVFQKRTTQALKRESQLTEEVQLARMRTTELEEERRLQQQRNAELVAERRLQQQRNAELELQTRKQESITERMNVIVDDLTNTRRIRSELLQALQSALGEAGIRVEIDTDHGILHLTEQAIHFPSGKARLPDSEAWKLGVIGRVLADVVPCYAANPTPPATCQPSRRVKLESVFIEGHTDNMPYRRGNADNWELSAARATYTYRAIVLQTTPELGELRNADDFPLFGVSGYGEGRPREGHRYGQPTPEPANRRIDLRFIMMPPTDRRGIPPELEGRL